ncbi:MAG: restriction endonuclease subunit S [Fimbriimonadaceae bacterium]
MNTAETLITEHLDIWTSAIKAKSSAGRGGGKKEEFYGIKKLRELILELAVRGLLVPQDPNDEPASEDLKRIAAEKARIHKEAGRKIARTTHSLLGSDIVFGCPQTWKWIRLQDVSEYIQRGKGPKYTDVGSVRVISQKCVQWSGFDLSPARFIADESLDKYGPERFLKTNDLLWNSTGTGTAGRINRIEGIDNHRLVADSHVTVVRLLGFDSKFLCVYISSPCVQSRISPTHEQSLVSGTTNQVELNARIVTTLPIPFPPLAEQQRIVAKVDELMSLCDQLEQQQEDSARAHNLLVETLLGALTSASERGQFEQIWQQIEANFDTLFTTESSIDHLKQTILQLAIMGKLVPQDPEDEPVTELLERIRMEKEQQIINAEMKRHKPLPEISESELPFEIPEGWAFVRLNDLCGWITSGSTPPGSDFSESPGIPFLKVYNIRNQKIDFYYRPQFINANCHASKLKRSCLLPGDVVMNIVGPPLGKVAIVPRDYPEWNCNQAIVFFRPIEGRLSPYIYTFLRAGHFLQYIELIGTAGQDNISVTKSRSIVLPLPPLAEQQRIVAKVDELVNLCDRLKDRLKAAQKIQLDLADNLVAAAIQ